jgi:DNA-binding beta-propeller fold protein YncE
MKLLPSLSQFCLCASLLHFAGFAAPAADLLVPGEPIVLTGTHGKFDFLAIDREKRRLLAAHTGNASLDVIDLDQKALIKSVPTGAAQSSAVDTKGDRYYASVSKPPQVVIIDAAKLEVVGKVPLNGPADISAFNAESGKVYVDHDDGKEVWVVDPAKQTVAATVQLPGDSPEDLGFDSAFKRLFQALKTSSVIAVIDVAENKVVASWPTAPAQAPHGMAMMPEDEAFLVAGGNGKLVMMSQKDGHVIGSTDIPPRVDQIAYDAAMHRAYCASGTGKIAVVSVEKGALASLGEVASSEGCHSIAVDPKTHSVWIAYAKGDASYVRPFTAPK